MERLKPALADYYTLEREIGRGGMASVYLAQDLKHGRPVALKVLHAELSSVIGVERFLREIQTAARFTHPHILPVHDSGETDGFLWYTMPYIEGESLRDRLRREVQLPVEEAVRLAWEVADALGYAHSQGVVHRDIKPENVLLSRGHAVVADFGLAKALSDGGEQLTHSGMSVGTPAYMSPEQAGGGSIDARTDVYALGCVLYEMLAGERPTDPAIDKRVAQDDLQGLNFPPVVPEHIQKALQIALAPVAAERFPTGAEFAHALALAIPVAIPPILRGTAPTETQRRTRLQAGPGFIAVGIALALAMTVGWIFYRRRSEGAAVNPRLVAVFPFRVSGADPALAYLREGMVELLAVKLTGEGGLRAVDPSAVLSAWRRNGGAQELNRAAALGIARKLGAGKVIQGSIVGSPTRLTLNAALLVGAGDDARISVEGPVDSLSALVDRLTAGVLTSETGDEAQLAEVATASLPALRAYMDGRSYYQRGDYRKAIRQFQHALAIDSTFAIAGLGLANAGLWVGPQWADQGVQIAWRHREQLGPSDRAMLDALAGPRYPAPSSRLEQLRAWERVVELSPDRPDAWYGLGDQFYHWGSLLGISQSWQRSETAFERALQIDPAFSGPLEHMVEMAARFGDTAKAGRLARLALASDSTSEGSTYVRWRLAVAKGDSFELRQVRAELDAMPFQSLEELIMYSQYDGLDMADARQAMAAISHRATTKEERSYAAYAAILTALNGGRPLQALQHYRARSELPDDIRRNYSAEVLVAAFWDGDTNVAKSAAHELSLLETASLASTGEQAQQVEGRCALEQWRLSRGELVSVDRTIEFLDGLDPAREEAAGSFVARVCARMLDAWQAVLRRSPESGQKISILDSISHNGPAGPDMLFQQANLILSRLFQAQGDLPRALDAIRRRHFGMGIPFYLSTYLREEGRLAALTCDRAGAIGAYRHYLALRNDPELSLQPEAEEVRKELAKLLTKQ